MALREAIRWDPALGRQVSASPTDYHLPAGPDVPQALDIGFVETGDADSDEFSRAFQVHPRFWCNWMEHRVVRGHMGRTFLEV